MIHRKAECTVFSLRYEGNFFNKISTKFRNSRPLHCSGGLSPTSHNGGPCSVPSQSTSGFCRTKWQLDRFIAEYCDPFSPVTIIPPMLHTHFYLYSVLKGKGNSITGHEGPEGESRYSSTFSLTSALDGVGGQRHAPAALPPGKTRYLLYRRLGGPQSRTGQVRKNSSQPGFDPRSVQPDRLSYPGPTFCSYHDENWTKPQSLPEKKCSSGSVEKIGQYSTFPFFVSGKAIRKKNVF
jgi:hypothetical protein